jgi:hypothetical protein
VCFDAVSCVVFLTPLLLTLGEVGGLFGGGRRDVVCLIFGSWKEREASGVLFDSLFLFEIPRFSC